ncbi:Ig-like domain repeat protein [Kutzneria sp. NPDC052558]|uniref:Ig-like domain repeat protein n=1 Tax=Kutzneria sp. NPDC052558 TaxID=3364121 RepID=UPI0037C9F42D
MRSARGWAAVSLAAALLVGGGAPLAHAAGDAKLVGAAVSFHTNDENKDFDTHVTVTVRDRNNVVAAVISADFERFDTNTDYGPYQLAIQNQSSWQDLRSGVTTIDIDPNGNDTWRFNFTVDLTFADGSHLGNQIGGVELTQDRTSNSWNILPPLDDYYARMDFSWIPQARTVADSVRLAQDRRIPPLLWEGCLSADQSGKGEGYLTHVLAEVGLLKVIEDPDGRAELTRAFTGTPSPVADPRHVYQDCLDQLAANWRVGTGVLSTTPGWTKVIADVRRVPALSGKPGTDSVPTCRTGGGDQDEWDFTMALMIRVWGLLKQESPATLFGVNDPARFDQLRRDLADRAWLQGSAQDVDATVCKILGVSVPETENHQFLIRTTRLLHNESLPMVTPPAGAYVSVYDKDTNTDNNANGVSAYVHGKLGGVLSGDWIEYNARGYSRYQMIGLLNLYDFAADPSVRADAKKVLDFLALKHVSEAEDSKRIAPFRRKAEKQSDLLFGVDPVDPMFEQLIGGLPQPSTPPAGGGSVSEEMALPSTTGYRPPAWMYDLALSRQHRDFYQHFDGQHQGEISYGGPDFTLSGGGAPTQCPYPAGALGCVGSGNDPGTVEPIVLMPHRNRTAGDNRDDYPSYHNEIWVDQGSVTGKQECLYRNFACGAAVHVPDNIVNNVPGCRVASGSDTALRFDSSCSPSYAGDCFFVYTSSTGGIAYLVTHSCDPSAGDPAIANAFQAFIGYERTTGKASAGSSAITLSLPTSAVDLTGAPAGESVTGRVSGGYQVDAPGSGQTGQALSGDLTLSGGRFPVPSQTLTASLSGQSVGLTAVTSGIGSVTFLDGSAVLGTSTVDGSGAARLTATLAPGQHRITAVYNGNATYVAAMADTSVTVV